MKNILLILLLSISLNTFAGIRQLKKELKACEIALKECVCTKEYKIDTITIIYIDGNNAVKIAKAKEVTKRKEIAVGARKENINTRKSIKTNFVFQFFKTIRAFLTHLTISQTLTGTLGVGGLIGLVGGFFEKYKPITKIVSKFL